MKEIKVLNSRGTSLLGSRYYICFSIAFISLFFLSNSIVPSFYSGSSIPIILVISYVIGYFGIQKIFVLITDKQKPTLKYNEKKKKLHFSRGFQTVTLDSKTLDVFFEVKRKPQKHIELSYSWIEKEKHNNFISNVLTIEICIEETETINEIYKLWYGEDWLDFEKAMRYKEKSN